MIQSALRCQTHHKSLADIAGTYAVPVSLEKPIKLSLGEKGVDQTHVSCLAEPNSCCNFLAHICNLIQGTICMPSTHNTCISHVVRSVHFAGGSLARDKYELHAYVMPDSSAVSQLAFSAPTQAVGGMSGAPKTRKPAAKP